MSPLSDDLTGLKDDMIAFIEGLGMRRFFGYVKGRIRASWDSGPNPMDEGFCRLKVGGSST
jgi:hypothetical protein